MTNKFRRKLEYGPSDNLTGVNLHANFFEQISEVIFYRSVDDQDLSQILEQLKAEYSFDRIRREQIDGLVAGLRGARDFSQLEVNQINREYEKDHVFKAITIPEEGLDAGRDIYQTLRLLGYTSSEIRTIILADMDPEQNGRNILHTADAWFEFMLNGISVMEHETQEPPMIREPLSV